jgi:prephenate dehydratase
VKLGVAFQGERGAFSEEAAWRMFGRRVATLPQRSFDDMFASVASGAADCAMAPVENTLAGSVIRNYDLLLGHDLVIVGEVVLRVVLNVMALPGVTLAEIKRVYSHPVALAQCERFFAGHPHLEAVPAYDTAGAVKMVVAGARRDEAAIAGAPAADAYGARILVSGIEGSRRNVTRFLALARPDRAAALPLPTERGRERKTTVAFHLGRPGALDRSLAGFAEAGVDLTKIESRPIEGRPGEHWCCIDFIGDRTDPPVQRALAHLGAHTDRLRILGSYGKG